MGNVPVRRFQDLETWQVGMELTMTAYEIAGALPANERFELSSQIRRAAVSVPANVAEGHASGKDGLFIRHLHIALGSVGELETLFEVARRLGYVRDGALGRPMEQLVRAGQLLHGLLRSAQRRRAAAAGTRFALLLGPPLWLLFPVLHQCGFRFC